MGGPDTSRKEHERGFAEFVAPPRREKYRTTFNTPKKRAKLADDLAHDNPFDDGCIVWIFTEDVTADAVYGELKERGAPDWCHHFEQTGKWSEIPLREVLESLVGPEHSGAHGFVSCIPGRLAYYQGEDPWDKIVLERGHSVRKAATPTGVVRGPVHVVAAQALIDAQEASRMVGLTANQFIELAEDIGLPGVQRSSAQYYDREEIKAVAGKLLVGIGDGPDASRLWSVIIELSRPDESE